MRLITSIPPRFSRTDPRSGTEIGADYLASCLNSWKANGFDPVSINPSKEVDQVRALELPIEVIGIDNSEAFYPERGPCFGAAFDTLRTNEPVAFVNCDIYMLKAAHAADIISSMAAGCFVTSWRTDIERLGCSLGREFKSGYDFMAFTPATIPNAFHNKDFRKFQFGIPWWDYALPLLAQRDVPLLRLAAPFIVHQAHPLAWSKQSFEQIGIQTGALLAQARPDAFQGATHLSPHDLALRCIGILFKTPWPTLHMECETEPNFPTPLKLWVKPFAQQRKIVYRVRDQLRRLRRSLKTASTA